MSGDPLAATPKKPTIIFLGDSITTGQYVNQVKEMIPGCTVHRYAKSGYTSEQVKREFLESAIAKNPTVMVIMVGANDIWQGKTLESVVKNIGAMVSVANKKEIPVILVTIPPMRKYLEGENPKEGFDEYVEKNIDRGMDIDSLVDGAERAEARTNTGMSRKKQETLKQANSWIRKQSKAGRVEIVDVYSILEDKDKKNAGQEGYQKQEYTTDGLHFNAKGHAALAKAVESAVRKVLTRTSAKKTKQQEPPRIVH